MVLLPPARRTRAPRDLKLSVFRVGPGPSVSPPRTLRTPLSQAKPFLFDPPPLLTGDKSRRAKLSHIANQKTMLPLSFYSTAQSAVSSAAVAAHGRSSLQMGGSSAVAIKPWDVKQEGGQRDSGWGSETKCHSRDPKPTVLDPTDPKARQTYVPPSETFEEYMKRRAAQAGNKKQEQVVQAKAQPGSARKAGGSSGYSAMYLRA